METYLNFSSQDIIDFTIHTVAHLLFFFFAPPFFFSSESLIHAQCHADDAHSLVPTPALARQLLNKGVVGFFVFGWLVLSLGGTLLRRWTFESSVC
jgi:hypothetical protein